MIPLCNNPTEPGRRHVPRWLPIIPFLDLSSQHRAIRADLAKAISRVLDSGRFVSGENVSRLEDSFAAYCGSAHAAAVNTGTSALHLALLAAGIKSGDEVITVSMTFSATVAAILYVGAVPRLVDIDPTSWTMDPERFASAITPRTKAVIPVHLHGRLANMDTILAIARSRGIAVIEDAAQAHGAQRAGRRAGSFGDLGCFSFYPGKNLGACGEGGAVVTDDAVLAKRVRLLRNWGQETKSLQELRGYNYRMDEIQAAVLNVKLAHIQAWTEMRRDIAARYQARFDAFSIGTPAVSDGSDHVYHVYAIRVRDRDDVRRRLSAAGIESGVHYSVPVHLQPAYADLGYRAGAFPVTEALAAETLSLPIYPEMTEEQVDRVRQKVTDICAPKWVDHVVVC